MISSNLPFEVIEHSVDCQHAREHPHISRQIAETSQPWRLAVKEYRPLHAPSSEDDRQQLAVTVVALHANGVPKESYEPLWASLLSDRSPPSKPYSTRPPPRIGAIFIADLPRQSDSDLLSDASRPEDRSHDLLCMINQLRERMTGPIVGLAHAFGCAQLTQLSNMHPSLFAGLAFMEPLIQDEDFMDADGTTVIKDISFKQSRTAAESALSRNDAFFTQLEPAALDQYLRYGLQQTPSAADDSVTMTTAEAQAAFTSLRLTAMPQVLNEQQECQLNPDLSLSTPNEEMDAYDWEAACTSSAQAFDLLPGLRPPVLYVYSEGSIVNTPARRAEKMDVTGTGPGGSGGARLGLVSEAIAPGSRHILSFQQVPDTAAVLGTWLADIAARWTGQQDSQDSLDGAEDLRLSREWEQAMQDKTGVKRAFRAKI